MDPKFGCIHHRIVCWFKIRIEPLEFMTSTIDDGLIKARNR
jgi:hypothetical protein